MAYDAEFNRLETVVEKLFEKYSALKQQNVALENTLQQKSHEMNELQQTVDKYMDEKEQVHKRVTGLIDSIDKWEKNAEASQGEKETTQSEEGQLQESEDDGKSDTASQLFSLSG